MFHHGLHHNTMYRNLMTVLEPRLNLGCTMILTKSMVNHGPISQGDERRNTIDFGSRGQRSRSTLALCTKVKVNFGTLYIKPYGHDSDYSFCPITFKLHMHIHHDEKRNPIDFGSQVQRSRSTWHSLYKTLWAR